MVNSGNDNQPKKRRQPPKYPTINAMVAHERAVPLAVYVAMDMGLRENEIGLEPSPQNLQG